jgi:hypothetical protein
MCGHRRAGILWPVKDAITAPQACEVAGQPDLLTLTAACTAAPGHFDELRAAARPSSAPTPDAKVPQTGALTAPWQEFSTIWPTRVLPN